MLAHQDFCLLFTSNHLKSVRTYTYIVLLYETHYIDQFHWFCCWIHCKYHLLCFFLFILDRIFLLRFSATFSIIIIVRVTTYYYFLHFQMYHLWFFFLWFLFLRPYHNFFSFRLNGNEIDEWLMKTSK